MIINYFFSCKLEEEIEGDEYLLPLNSLLLPLGYPSFLITLTISFCIDVNGVLAEPTLLRRDRDDFDFDCERVCME